MGEQERNSSASTKYDETKYDETKSDKTNEAKLTNIQTAQQAQAYRMDCTSKNITLLAKQLSQTIQYH